MATETMRAQIKAKPNGGKFVFGPKGDTSNILNPMYDFNGGEGALLFPFTPNVSFGGAAEYDEYAFTHSIYRYLAYSKSAPTEITVSGDFTAQTDKEAQYLLAVFHFLKSVTKSYFGLSSGNLAGTPPPILLFDYLGQHMFRDVPVVIKSYSYVLDPGVDYVPAAPGGRPYDAETVSYVPTQCQITIVMETQYNTKTLREDFDLDKFRQGKFLQGGGDGGFV